MHHSYKVAPSEIFFDGWDFQSLPLHWSFRWSWTLETQILAQTRRQSLWQLHPLSCQVICCVPYTLLGLKNLSFMFLASFVSFKLDQMKHFEFALWLWNLWFDWLMQSECGSADSLSTKVLKQCLGSQTDWADLWRARGCNDLATSHVPIIVHEDGVPHFSGALVARITFFLCNVRNAILSVDVWCFVVDYRGPGSGSTATVWSWSTGCLRADSWKTRQCIGVMATSQVTDSTRDKICKLLAWDFSQLQNGIWDLLDSNGKFHKLNSKQERRAGQTMPMKAATGQQI